jgi:hypothetical protein
MVLLQTLFFLYLLSSSEPPHTAIRSSSFAESSSLHFLYSQDRWYYLLFSFFLGGYLSFVSTRTSPSSSDIDLDHNRDLSPTELSAVPGFATYSHAGLKIILIVSQFSFSICFQHKLSCICYNNMTFVAWGMTYSENEQGVVWLKWPIQMLNTVRYD